MDHLKGCSTWPGTQGRSNHQSDETAGGGRQDWRIAKLEGGVESVDGCIHADRHFIGKGMEAGINIPAQDQHG